MGVKKGSPVARYESDLCKPGFVADQAQRVAVDHLQGLYEQLVARKSGLKNGLWWQKLTGRAKAVFIPSLYFWGGVGRGKTYLMDMFYEALPFDDKLRTHFHRFMRRVHEELTHLKGEKNPLEKVADTLANEASVICFDEFFVSDITDAMILANLLKALFERDVVLVMTSNIEPNGLYKDGLQRDRFIPAIHLINEKAKVLNVDGGTDYRLRELKKVTLYHTPVNDHTRSLLVQYFERLVPDSGVVCKNVTLNIEGRNILAALEADDVVLFDFLALCDGPRSQYDYIELAREYHTVLLAGVPALGRSNDDQARRFVYLVDEFYDRRVKLILSADRPLPDLYAEGKLKFEFDRTVSRLLEMQSEEYLASAHRA